MENIMSEEFEVDNTSVDDVLAAIQQKNLAQAKGHFEDLMGAKINDALGAEKIKIADSIFNQRAELEAEQHEEDEDETELSSENMESELESMFDEDEV
jgi:Rps23 Pro-64 3,4-dihydroxylase Tpa1-like proline 4-hydroxylase